MLCCLEFQIVSFKHNKNSSIYLHHHLLRYILNWYLLSYKNIFVFPQINFFFLLFCLLNDILQWISHPSTYVGCVEICRKKGRKFHRKSISFSKMCVRHYLKGFFTRFSFAQYHLFIIYYQWALYPSSYTPKFIEYLCIRSWVVVFIYDLSLSLSL